MIHVHSTPCNVLLLYRRIMSGGSRPSDALVGVGDDH